MKNSHTSDTERRVEAEPARGSIKFYEMLNGEYLAVKYNGTYDVNNLEAHMEVINAAIGKDEPAALIALAEKLKPGRK